MSPCPRGADRLDGSTTCAILYGSLNNNVRILVDYRPALRQRTGVGEYTHEIVRAYAQTSRDQLTVFTSSWRDRPSSDLSAELGVRVIDRRVPVRVLNTCWGRFGWPPVEWVAGEGPYDVVHSSSPLLIPSQSAAQIVSLFDVYFATVTDAPPLPRGAADTDRARVHAQLADAIVTTSDYSRRAIVGQFAVAAERIHVCPPGVPSWCQEVIRRPSDVPYVLFVGTLESRKNLGVVLDAWAALTARAGGRYRLVVAGGNGDAAEVWNARARHADMHGTIDVRGYVSDNERRALYAAASALVLPSHDEGFGLPVLEAMAVGVPVLASDRGALPEVTAGAALLLPPDDAEAWSSALERVLADQTLADALSARGRTRATAYSWDTGAQALRAAYEAAVERREARRR